MEMSKAAVMVITETWLNSKKMHAVENAHVAQSPLHNRQGVMIVCKEPIIQMQPVFAEAWTSTLVAVSLAARLPDGRRTHFYVLGAYAPPGSQKETEKQIEYICQKLHERHPAPQILLMGDLNQPPEKARRLANSVGLELCQNDDQDLITHEVSMRGRRSTA